MTITIHRGINQIGGCITEIASASGHKILIDLGHNLPEGDAQSYDPLEKAENIDPILEGVEAVFYTHSHGDHIGFEAHVAEKGIKQYIGVLAKEVMIAHRKHMTHAPALKEEAERSLAAINKFIPYHITKSVSIGDIKVTPYKVNHSACDAYMFVIDCDGRRILHTGDFRTHGYLGNRLELVLKNYIRNIDVLITEGTMLSQNRSVMRTEKMLMEEAVQIMRQYDNVFVLCSSQDADRLASFNIASCRLRRPMVVDGYQHRILRIMEQHLSRYQCYHYEQKRNYYEEEKNVPRWIANRGITMMIRATDTFSKIINTLKPYLDFDHTCLIYSMFEGYIDENRNTFQRGLYDFIHSCDWHIENLHTSGHASREALAMVCNKVNPRLAIIPIHREAESDFRSLNIPQELKDKVHTESTVIKDVKIVIK